MSISRKKLFFRLFQISGLAVLPILSRSQSPSEFKEIFSQAESYFLYGEYELANELYLLLDAPDNYNIKYKIGECYLNIPGEKDKSIAYLEEAVKNASYESKESIYKEKRAPLDAYYSLAKGYMINNDPEKGMNTFRTFNKLASGTKGGMENLEFVTQQIQACSNAISFREKPILFSRSLPGEAINAGAINENPAVSYDGNTLVFTERRGILNSIWFSKKIREVWQPPIEITDQLNAGTDCSTCSLNKDGTELFLYKTDDYDGVIYSSKYVNDSWTPVVKLNKNINTRYYESHAAVSADGSRLYFTSNREGGFGELDIYVSERGADGEWGIAKNLGPSVNTAYNEDTPFITQNDSLLYFSSEGHDSMGGFDVFVSARSDSSWLPPVNLGHPLNTADDDKFLQPVNDGANAFYSFTTDYKKKDIFYIVFGDTSLAGPAPVMYEKINLENIPVVDEVDSALLIMNMNVTDVTEQSGNKEDILFYTVQVIALYKPVDISYFKHIDDLKIMYNDTDRFYRYTTGEFSTIGEAQKWRLQLLSKGYPSEIFVKKVTGNKQ